MNTLFDRLTHRSLPSIPAKVGRVLLGGLLAVVLLPLQAAQPLTTDDADVKAARDCEWDSSIEHARPANADATTAWTTQVGCGIGANTELAAGAGRTRGDGDAGTSWSVSGKTGLRARTDEQAGLAIGWSVLADQSPGVPPKAHGWTVDAIASSTLGFGWLGHVNLGVGYDRPTHRARLSWAAATEHPLGEALDITLETFGAGLDQPTVAAGLRWTVDPRLVIGLAYKRQLSGPPANVGTLTATIAF